MDIQRKDVHNSDTPLLCQACESRHRGVCGALTSEQLLQLSKHSTRRTVEPGNRTGWRKPEDKDLLQHHFRRGETVQDDGRWAPADRRSAVRPRFSRPSVPAGKRCQRAGRHRGQGVLLPEAAIERMIREMPELEHKLLEQTLTELDEARDWMLTLGRKTAGEKVASFLLLIATHAFPDNESDIGDVRSAYEPNRHCRFPWPDHGNRQPPADQAAQGRCDPHRQQSAMSPVPDLCHGCPTAPASDLGARCAPVATPLSLTCGRPRQLLFAYRPQLFYARPS
jgi:CRP/FNR family transcriptional regulator